MHGRRHFFWQSTNNSRKFDLLEKDLMEPLENTNNIFVVLGSYQQGLSYYVHGPACRWLHVTLLGVHNHQVATQWWVYTLFATTRLFEMAKSSHVEIEDNRVLLHRL